MLGTSQSDNIHFIYNELLGKFTACVTNGYMVPFPKQLSIALGLGDTEVTLRQSSNQNAFGVTHKNTRTVFHGPKIKAPYTIDLN